MASIIKAFFNNIINIKPKKNYTFKRKKRANGFNNF